MQALILATEETPVNGGTQLHPLTEHTPAPLLPVLNRPMMAYALELLVRAGLRDIGVAVYKRAGCIEAHFGAGTGSGAQLTYLLQREPLGSAGSLRWAASGLKETFVVLPGDALLDFDLCAALAFHKSHGGIATVIAHAPLPHKAQTRSPLRAVQVGPDGRVTALPPAEEPGSAVSAEALAGSQILAATGAYIFEPRILDCIPPRRSFDCYADLLPALLAGGAREAANTYGVHAYVAEGYWNPIDSVSAYHRAQLDALASATGASSAEPSPTTPGVRYVSVQDRELAPRILAGRHVSIHPSARLIAPVYIGSGSHIEEGVELGPDVVIGPNTIVDEGATIRNSSVLEGTYVGRLVNVDSRVVRGGLVIDAGSGESLRVVDRFLLGEVSPRLVVGPLARLLARGADCVGALLLLLLALPLLALLTLALLLASVFAGQPGRVFELRPHVRWRQSDGSDAAPADGASERETYQLPYFRTRRTDGRPAPLAAFLERTDLDRLPALLSVLKGDLRLVGVKPLDPSEADLLVEEWQRLPYETPWTSAPSTGFTGLWYVLLAQQGARGASLDEIAATDAYYAATRSFLEDLHVLLSTPAAWVRRWAPPHATPMLPSAKTPKRTEQRRWTPWRSRGARRRFTGRPLTSAAKAAKD